MNETLKFGIWFSLVILLSVAVTGIIVYSPFLGFCSLGIASAFIAYFVLYTPNWLKEIGNK